MYSFNINLWYCTHEIVNALLLPVPRSSWLIVGKINTRVKKRCVFGMLVVKICSRASKSLVTEKCIGIHTRNCTNSSLPKLSEYTDMVIFFFLDFVSRYLTGCLLCFASYNLDTLSFLHVGILMCFSARVLF